MVNFGNLESEYSTDNGSKIVMLPVPYDGTGTWIKGADKGPEAIIEASSHLELYDIETNSEVYRNGIYTCSPVIECTSPEEMIKAVRRKTRKFLKKDTFVVTLGGEHTVSIGAVQAYKEVYDNLSVIQLDAHADLRNEYEGSMYNHACVAARIKEICSLVQVGIRSMDITEKKHIDTDSIFYADAMVVDKSWQEKAICRLSENVYITIDLDFFDPSIIPSTGTPEPGGLLWYETLIFLKKVSEEKNIVGFDIVELCPNPANKAPDFLAAKLIYKLLSYIFEKERR